MLCCIQQRIHQKIQQNGGRENENNFMEEFAEVTLVHTEELLHMHHTQEFRDMSFRERLLRLMKMTED